jgi:hypothetical protein
MILKTEQRPRATCGQGLIGPTQIPRVWRRLDPATRRAVAITWAHLVVQAANRREAEGRDEPATDR